MYAFGLKGTTHDSEQLNHGLVWCIQGRLEGPTPGRQSSAVTVCSSTAVEAVT